MSRGSKLNDTVMEYLSTHIGEDLYVGRIATELGLTTVQVSSCILRLRRDNPILHNEIQVIIRGSCWRYRPTPVQPAIVPSISAPPTSAATSALPTPNASKTSTGEIYEYVGSIGENVVVKGEDGCLYRLEPLR